MYKCELVRSNAIFCHGKTKLVIQSSCHDFFQMIKCNAEWAVSLTSIL